MIEKAILIVSACISAGIGSFVFIRNPRRLINKLFAALTLALVCFPIANYFSLNSTHRLLFIRVVVFLSTIAVALMYYLILFLGEKKHKMTALQRQGVIFTTVVAVLDLTPLVFSGLYGGTNPTPIPRMGAILFLTQLVIFPAASLWILIKRSRKEKGLLKLQSIFMLIGVTPVLLLAPITGFLLPVLYHNAKFITLNPLYILFFTGFVGYAIFKHKLFDVRAAVARALAYSAAIVILASLYGIIVFGVAIFIFHAKISVWLQVYFSGATALAALAFGRLKVFFDRATNRIFYQDSYEPQALYAELNKILVSSIDITYLLRHTTTLLASTLKAEYCAIGLKNATGYRLEGTQKRDYNRHDIDLARSLTPHMHRRVILTDDLEGIYAPLRVALQANNIALLVRLAPNVKRSEEGLGYIMFGPKKSGNPYGAQDVEVLDTIADEVVITIQNALHFEEISNFNETLQARVNTATHKLQQTNTKLKALDATKDEFISMASHQLRTPLTAVKGYLSMVLEGDAGQLNPGQRKLLEQSFTSAQRMVYLISDLLNLSRLNTGKFVIAPTAVQLADVVKAEVEQLTETAKSREITLRYEPPATLPALLLDETKIHQVVMNFIDNAIYYTPAGGQITVSLRETPAAVEYRVKDTGIGVPRAQQHHLFTKFYRAENARKARPDGTGLGLFMAKKVIAAQGGAIIFESEEGKGSTFGFRFNKAHHLAPPVEPTKITTA